MDPVLQDLLVLTLVRLVPSASVLPLKTSAYSTLRTLASVLILTWMTSVPFPFLEDPYVPCGDP